MSWAGCRQHFMVTLSSGIHVSKGEMGICPAFESTSQQIGPVVVRAASTRLTDGASFPRMPCLARATEGGGDKLPLILLLSLWSGYAHFGQPPAPLSPSGPAGEWGSGSQCLTPTSAPQSCTCLGHPEPSLLRSCLLSGSGACGS